ncbi:MAG: PEP/pyruvate-binding domain-containing protein [Candidatus Electrothrix aestuarii]|uniref:PEP/pyruvate-binding domain-containing protein n=1 Tax=Candidatus Electrothrix aestuarii TaxID=3062594 RepID=A0AAU8LTN1_9BACT|nr:PEP/pyruvate-binding domain-containing protein [Candidatus Electrothrix aestuarii]
MNPGAFASHDPHFKIFHELMKFRVQEILLVSSPYDAYILEEDGSMASRIINEYHGLNLSRPPRITRTANAEQALELLRQQHFDLVVTMAHLNGMAGCEFAVKIREICPQIPVILLTHSVRDAINQTDFFQKPCFDNSYTWCCDSSIMLALVKNAEDQRNVDHDTEKAMVRVILLVEDSPLHRSILLPMLYEELVQQTLAVLDEGLNEQHRLLKMRARPKILTAASYEEAIALFSRYRPYIFSVMSDGRFPKNGEESDTAGFELLNEIRARVPDLPLLMLSSESGNREIAHKIPAVFIEKIPRSMGEELHNFFIHHLGFGDFIFRTPKGREVGRASTLYEFEQQLSTVPEESLLYHARCNHFSNWVMARAEVSLAARIHKDQLKEIKGCAAARCDLIAKVRSLRESRQQGVMTRFSTKDFDPEVTEFTRIGRGSVGGKARGIAFMASELHQARYKQAVFAENTVKIPQTCVIAASGFIDFINLNKLHADEQLTDKKIEQRFLAGTLPDWLLKDLRAYLEHIHYPLSVRSSSLLEDARYRPYAGLYHTCMLKNNATDFNERLDQLVYAVKRVYASTWFESPRAYSHSIGQTRVDAMAVIIQQAVGRPYGKFFYPAISGVAQSYNYYPLDPMQAEDGIVHLATGFGKTVVEGEQSLRFCPAYPRHMPQFSTVEDILNNAQRHFYCLPYHQKADPISSLIMRQLEEAENEEAIQFLSSTYIPEEHRIRDSRVPGPKVLTFVPILKYNFYPLAALLKEVLTLGREGMGCEVEVEFAVDLADDPAKSTFYFLQIRPIVVGNEMEQLHITAEEKETAFLASQDALGYGRHDSMQDIVFVPPNSFDRTKTRSYAQIIGRINRVLHQQERPFLLIGPGRWGSADHWLGIPVQWRDISGVGAIVELQNEGVRAEASQGSHFFQNITSLGIPYLMVREEDKHDRIDWDWLLAQHKKSEQGGVCHVRLEQPFTVKVDGKSNEAVGFVQDGEAAEK